MALDVKTKIFSREDVNTFLNAFKMLDSGPAEMPRDWTIHVGPGSICKIKFEGPVGADEWDALLAHIAFYKQWYKDKPTTPLINLSDAVDEIHRRITTSPDAAA